MDQPTQEQQLAQPLGVSDLVLDSEQQLLCPDQDVVGQQRAPSDPAFAVKELNGRYPAPVAWRILMRSRLRRADGGWPPGRCLRCLAQLMAVPLISSLVVWNPRRGSASIARPDLAQARVREPSVRLRSAAGLCYTAYCPFNGLSRSRRGQG
jgi:hypothetical protein